jgi:hypothetical protein
VRLADAERKTGDARSGEPNHIRPRESRVEVVVVHVRPPSERTIALISMPYG